MTRFSFLGGIVSDFWKGRGDAERGGMCEINSVLSEGWMRRGRVIRAIIWELGGEAF